MRGLAVDGFGRAIWVLRYIYSAVPLIGIATGGLYPVIALSLSGQGYSETTIGAVTTAWYFGAFLGSATYAIVVNRLGYKASFTLTVVVAGVATWALSLTTDAGLWTVLRFIAGFALGSYYLVVDSWISSLGTDRNRGRLLAFYEAVRIVAVALGPILMSAISLQGSFLLAGMLFLLGAIPVWFAPTPPVAAEPLSIKGVVEVFGRSPFAMLCVFTSGMIISSFYGLGAVYAKQIGLSPEGIAVFVSVCLLAPAVTQVPAGALGDRFGRALVASSTCLIGAVIAATLAGDMVTTPILVIAVGALAIGMSQPLYPLGVSHALAVTGPDATLGTITSALLAYNSGTALGPLFAGQAMGFFGAGGLYVWISVTMGLVGLIGLIKAVQVPRTTTRRPAVNDE